MSSYHYTHDMAMKGHRLIAAILLLALVAIVIVKLVRA